MARKFRSKAARWRHVHQDALRKFDIIQSATLDDREQSMADRLFCDVAGMQWANLVDANDVRPRLELNKVSNSVAKIEGEYRNNRCLVTYLPKASDASQALADELANLFRADWHDSAGDDAADNAFADEVRGGYGAFFLYAGRDNEEDDDDMRQRVRFEPIVDPEKSVWWDLNSKRQDKSDARFAFRTITITPEEYDHRFDEDPSTWPVTVQISPLNFAWYQPDVVVVAEYYVIEDELETWLRFRNQMTGETFERRAADFEGDLEPEDEGYDAESNGRGPEKLRTILMSGNEQVGEYQKRCKVVKKYTMSGMRILKEERLAGRCIPIVTCYGKRTFVENKERWFGHVRLVKDAQRVLNALTSWLLEFAAHSVVSVPIWSPKQINAHQVTWTEFASGVPKAFLTIDPEVDANGAPIMGQPAGGWTKVPELPEALAAALQFIGIDIKELLGSQEQGEKMVSNISGKAVEMIQRRLDASIELYLDNFKKAMKRAGEIYVSIAEDIYVEPLRKLNTLAADGRTRNTVTLGEPTADDNGVVRRDGLVLDGARKMFDVVVDVGPSTSTKRQAAVRDLTALLQVMPAEDVKGRLIVSRKIMQSIEIEGGGDLNKWAEMDLLREGVGEPNEEQQQQLAAEAEAKKANPDPLAESEKAKAAAFAANAEKEKASAIKYVADADLAVANKAKAEAETAKIKAQTVDVVASIDLKTRPQQPPDRGGQTPPRPPST